MKTNNPYGNLFVGSGVIAKGKLNIPGEAIINGTVEGELNAASINVMSAGVVTGQSVADTITVSGKINQSTTARESLVIDATGTLAGEVSYGELEIRKGGELQGTIVMLPKSS
jgi:cytoskeletal protein CcmA (bactofilin family)